MSFCGHYHDTVAIAVTSRKFDWCSTTVGADRHHFGKVPGHECCSVPISAHWEGAEVGESECMRCVEFRGIVRVLGGSGILGSGC